MILRLSNKLARKIHVLPLEALPGIMPPLGDWAGNVFRAGRIQYILITNGTSLFSCIIPGRGITKIESLLERMQVMMRDVHDYYGLADMYDEIVMPHLIGKVVTSKVGNRSLTGSMSDHCLNSKCFLDEMELAPLEASIRLNETPMGALNHAFPIERHRFLFHECMN